MRSNFTRTSISAAALIVLMAGTGAQAQFATCITRPMALGPNPNPNPAFVHKLVLASGQSTVFFDPLAEPVIPATAPGFQGLAANDQARVLYAVTTNGLRSDLYAISYDTGVATFIAQCKIDPAVDNTATNANGVVLTGLAFDSTRNKLFGTRSLQGGSVPAGTFRPEGIYEVNLTTGQTTPVRTLETSPASDFTIDDIDYDAATDKFYMADDDDTGGRNIYALPASDLQAALELVVAYPAGVTDVDGLGAGGGKLLLLSDGLQGNGGFHKVYNLATATFEADIATPYPSYVPSSIGLVNPSGGAAYAPGLFGPVACTPSDVAGPGQTVGADGQLTADDIIVFVGWFFAADARADIAGSGQSVGADGQFTADDLILFINRFFAGC
jgi:hypothetical protein